MAIRLPLQTVLDVEDNGAIGASSAAGGIAHQFTIPQDTDNVVVKFTASTAGGGVSTVIQTTDDGGTTWYDVGRTSIVSNANSAVTAEWLNMAILGSGVRTTTSGSSSTTTGTTPTSVNGAIGRAGASTLGQLSVSGLPFMSQIARTFTIVGAAVTGVTSVRTQVKVNSQSATA